MAVKHCAVSDLKPALEGLSLYATLQPASPRQRAAGARGAFPGLSSWGEDFAFTSKGLLLTKQVHPWRGYFLLL